MADDGGWVQVQHKKPHQPHNQQKPQQQQKQAPQQRNGKVNTETKGTPLKQNQRPQPPHAKQYVTNTQNKNVNQTTTVRLKSAPINTPPAHPTKQPEKIQPKTPPKPLPTAIATPPKSILAYRETNPFDIVCFIYFSSR